MAIEGQLQDMNLPTLVQLILHDGGIARVRLQNQNRLGWLYLEEGRLSHAAITLADQQAENMSTGEEAVYEMLTWRSGEFVVERGKNAPTTTIGQSWDFLLMEGMRRLDENQFSRNERLATQTDATVDDGSPTLLASTRTEPTANGASSRKETQMASKSEELQSILSNVVGESSDIVGAVVVSPDGLLIASSFSRDEIDGNRVAAVSAGLVSLASRSAEQLNQGEVEQTLIQANQGNIIAVRANERGSFVALTPTNVNLGMAFLECRDATDAIRNVI